jgi:hypothetical protein
MPQGWDSLEFMIIIQIDRSSHRGPGPKPGTLQARRPPDGACGTDLPSTSVRELCLGLSDPRACIVCGLCLDGCELCLGPK